MCITGVSGVTIFYWLDKSSRWLISGQAGGLVEGDTFIHCWMFTFTSPTSNTRREKRSKQKPSLHQTVLHSTCFWSLIKRWTGADLVLFRSVPADDEKILLKITDWRLLMNLWAFVWRLRQNVVWLVFFCKLLMTWPSFIPPVSWLRLRPELVNTIKHMRGLSSPRSATKVMDDGWFSN